MARPMLAKVAPTRSQFVSRTQRAMPWTYSETFAAIMDPYWSVSFRTASAAAVTAGMRAKPSEVFSRSTDSSKRTSSSLYCWPARSASPESTFAKVPARRCSSAMPALPRISSGSMSATPKALATACRAWAFGSFWTTSAICRSAPIASTEPFGSRRISMLS